VNDDVEAAPHHVEPLTAYIDSLPEASQVYGDDRALVIQNGELRVTSVARLLGAVHRATGLPAASVVE
jgi:hypothetical protein